MVLREAPVLRRYWMKGMSWIINRMDQNACRYLSAAFVENQWMVDFLSRHMPAEDVIFAPPGVDTNLFIPDSYQKESYILAVGRLGDPRKNIPLLFRAYHHLLQRLPTAPRLMLAGKTMPGATVWKLAESLGIDARIETRQNLPAEKLAALYRHASLFVLSSEEEGLGIVLLEAMASGIPVVSTRCGGPETVVIPDQTGFLVPKEDFRTLADRMHELLTNPDRAERMGAAGRAHIEQYFSVEAASRKFLDRYDYLLST